MLTRLRVIVTPSILEISELTTFDVDVIDVPFIEKIAFLPNSCALVYILEDKRFPPSSQAEFVNPITSVKLLVPASILMYEAPSILEVTINLPFVSSQ